MPSRMPRKAATATKNVPRNQKVSNLSAESSFRMLIPAKKRKAGKKNQDFSIPRPVSENGFTKKERAAPESARNTPRESSLSAEKREESFSSDTRNLHKA